MEETENTAVICISNSRFAIRKWRRDGAGSDSMAGLAIRRARCSSTFRVPRDIRNPLWAQSVTNVLVTPCNGCYATEHRSVCATERRSQEEKSRQDTSATAERTEGRLRRGSVLHLCFRVRSCLQFFVVFHFRPRGERLTDWGGNLTGRSTRTRTGGFEAPGRGRRRRLQRLGFLPGGWSCD